MGRSQDDPDSSRFWTALGGRRFRLFQRSSEAFLQATPGRHWVVVRARDPRGGLRAARAAAPLLVEAESNFSISDATAGEPFQCLPFAAVSSFKAMMSSQAPASHGNKPSLRATAWRADGVAPPC